MPLVSTAGRNAGCDAIVDLVDAGTTNTEGRIVIQTAGGAVDLAVCPCNNPAFGDAAVGVATLDIDPVVEDDSADVTGTAAQFEVQDRDETPVLSGDVGTSGADLNLNSIAIQSGVKVTITSMTVTVPVGSV